MKKALFKREPSLEQLLADEGVWIEAAERLEKDAGITVETTLGFGVHHEFSEGEDDDDSAHARLAVERFRRAVDTATSRINLAHRVLQETGGNRIKSVLTRERRRVEWKEPWGRAIITPSRTLEGGTGSVARDLVAFREVVSAHADILEAQHVGRYVWTVTLCDKSSDGARFTNGIRNVGRIEAEIAADDPSTAVGLLLAYEQAVDGFVGRAPAPRHLDGVALKGICTSAIVARFPGMLVC